MNENINEADIEYEIIIRKSDSILSEVTKDPDERLIYESIIDNIERIAAETIKAGKIANLPSIGCIRKDPIRKVIQNNHENFRIARKHLTTEKYKDHVREILLDARIEQERKEKERINIKHVRSKYKKKYDNLYIKLGRSYAEMFIKSIMLMEVVHYDEEFQEHYDKLKDN